MRVILTIQIALAVMYLVVAFVTADVFWIRSVWEWDRGDRALLLVISFIVVGPPTLLILVLGGKKHD